MGTLREQIASKVQIPSADVCLKFHKNEITADHSIQRTLSDVGIQKDGDIVFLEKMDITADLARPWVIHIKTLTGTTFNIEISNPQVGLVEFVSLSHSHTDPPDTHTHAALPWLTLISVQHQFYCSQFPLFLSFLSSPSLHSSNCLF